MSLILESQSVPLRTDDRGVVRTSGTRVTLDTVVTAFRDGATAEEINERYPTVPLGDVYAVLAYYLKHRDDVDAYMAEGRRDAEQTRSELESRFDPNGVRDRLVARRGKQEP